MTSGCRWWRLRSVNMGRFLYGGLIAFLLPIRLSSTTKMMLSPAWRKPFELGQEGRKQSEARDRKVRALSQQADAVLRAPKGNFQAGIDDDDIGHGRLPGRADK